MIHSYRDFARWADEEWLASCERMLNDPRPLPNLAAHLRIPFSRFESWRQRWMFETFGNFA